MSDAASRPHLCRQHCEAGRDSAAKLQPENLSPKTDRRRRGGTIVTGPGAASGTSLIGVDRIYSNPVRIALSLKADLFYRLNLLPYDNIKPLENLTDLDLHGQGQRQNPIHNSHLSARSWTPADPISRPFDTLAWSAQARRKPASVV